MGPPVPHAVQRARNTLAKDVSHRTARCTADAGPRFVCLTTENRGPGSAAHHSASLRAALRPGHAHCQYGGYPEFASSAFSRQPIEGDEKMVVGAGDARRNVGREGYARRGG